MHAVNNYLGYRATTPSDFQACRWDLALSERGDMDAAEFAFHSRHDPAGNFTFSIIVRWFHATFAARLASLSPERTFPSPRRNPGGFLAGIHDTPSVRRQQPV